MRIKEILGREQAETIHRNALRVLEEIGVMVEHETLRAKLEGAGGRIVPGTETVRFAARDVERFIGSAKKKDERRGRPAIGGHVEIYKARYLDPETSVPTVFDRQKLEFYVGLARRLGFGDSTGMLGLPFVPEGESQDFFPLLGKLYSWRMGIMAFGSVHRTALCEPIIDMYRCHAEANGKKLEDCFFASGFLLSPLRLARSECEQLLFFAGKGLRMSIGNMPSAGGSAPVTIAGAVTQAIAEQIFIHILLRCVYGETGFGIGASVLGVDMRSGTPRFGRPEQQRVNLAFAGMAEFYGCGCSGLAGLTDAQTPSYEAGIHKATSVIVTALACGHSSVSAGMLDVDQLDSPVQMVLDADLVGSLKAIMAGISAEDGDCGLESIEEAVEARTHIGTEFTARRLREEYYLPRTWTGGRDKVVDGIALDARKALEVVREFGKTFSPESHITAGEERELAGIIERAKKTIGG